MNVVQAIRKGYRVEEIKRVDMPKPLARYDIMLRPSRINPEVMSIEAKGIDVVMRPLIGLKASSAKPWIYYIELEKPRLCIESQCYGMENRFKIAPLSEKSFIALSGKRGYLVEVLEEKLSLRDIDVGEIIGYTPFIDRTVLILSIRGLRRKTLAVDQGYTYNIGSYCIERAEGHSLVTYESDGYVRIYFGPDYGGYSFYDVRGSPETCNIGYRVASVRIGRKGSIYIGKGLYLETPLSSKAIAWIPEEKELLLYDERSRWLIESDLKNFKPIARLPEKPIYIGRTRDSHVLMLSGSILAIKESLLIRPEIPHQGFKALSAGYWGLVIDAGDKISIVSIEGRIYRELGKRGDATCWGFMDKLLCISGRFIGVVDPERDEEISIEELRSELGIYVKGSKGLIDIDLEGPIEILDRARDGDIYIARIAPKTLERIIGVKIRLTDPLGEFTVGTDIHIPLPEIEIESAEMATTSTGIHRACSTPGYARATFHMRGKIGLHDLYRYIARIRSRGRVIGETPFNYRGGSDPIELQICLDTAVEEAELEIAGIKDSDGNAFYSSSIRGRSIDVSPELEIVHGEGFSEIRLRIEAPKDLRIERAVLKLSCSNTSIEKSVEEKRELAMRVSGCETPARVSINIEAEGFMWSFLREIYLRDLEACLNRYVEQGILARIECSEGGFYKHIDYSPYEDRSPIRSIGISYARSCILSLDATRDASYIVVGMKGGIYRAGTIKLGSNRIELVGCGIDTPLRLCIYDGTVYREYMLLPPSLEDLIRQAYITSYKLLNILGRMVD
jgi:hypothetical protein